MNKGLVIVKIMGNNNNIAPDILLGNKTITVFMNTTDTNCLPYDQVRQAIKDGTPNISTNCLDFASFDYLDKGYEVVVCRYDGENFKTILLSKLLLNDRKNYPYCTHKDIRKAHNIQKMIKAECLEYL